MDMVFPELDGSRHVQHVAMLAAVSGFDLRRRRNHPAPCLLRGVTPAKPVSQREARGL
jgi:hypothetical protein